MKRDLFLWAKNADNVKKLLKIIIAVGKPQVVQLVEYIRTYIYLLVHYPKVIVCVCVCV